MKYNMPDCPFASAVVDTKTEMKTMSILDLTIKRKWFDMIFSREKKEEYREIKEYWATRLLYFKYTLEIGSFKGRTVYEDRIICEFCGHDNHVIEEVK